MPLKLPNAEGAVVEQRKITEYLLSFTNPRGLPKARFFTRAGFHIERWEVFAEALLAHCLQHEVMEITEKHYGVQYAIIGTVETPEGSTPRIKSVWQIDHGTDYPRLISAYPNTTRSRNVQ